MDAATLRDSVEMLRKNISNFEITGKGKGMALNNKFFSREDLEEASVKRLLYALLREGNAH